MTRLLRFRGAVAATVLLVAAGLVDGSPVLLLGAVVPLVYVAYGSVASVSIPDGLTATREVEPTPVPPGQPVTVTLEVRNDSARTITDCRLVDGVPDDLAVLEGQARTGTTLEPGETARLEYLVVARRGEYEFEPPQCRIRGLGASAVATTRIPVAGAATLDCRLDADAPPIEEVGRDRIGQLTTDRPGEGLTFHSVREHRPDDPADRIDWRHYAKRGTLATIDYERQVAATVVLVVDARRANAVVAGPGRPTAIEFAAYAATRTLSDLLGHGHDVGIAVIGRDGDGPAGLYWLEPASSREQRSRALEVLRTATEDLEEENASATRRSRTRGRTTKQSATAATPTSNWANANLNTKPATGVDGNRPDRPDRPDRIDRQVRKILELTPSGAQVALFSPLLDDPPVSAVERWRGAGVPTVVLSPDVVPTNTVSGQHTQVRRRTRLARCQSLGARTFDWRRGTPLPILIERAFTADARLSSARLGGQTGGARSDLGSGSESAAVSTSRSNSYSSSSTGGPAPWADADPEPEPESEPKTGGDP